MSERFSPDEFVKQLGEAFDSGHDMIFIPTGGSMRPMLGGVSDSVTLSPKRGRLCKYDVALYKRPQTGQLVLHRMIGFDDQGGYIFSGDGQYFREYGIADEDILAVMTAFTHNGKEHKVGETGYRLYSRLIPLSKKPLRLTAGVYHKFFRR